MFNKLISILMAIIFFAVSTGAGSVPQDNREQEPQEPIIEKRTVTNTQFPVRVFLEGRPVGGLDKNDFTLFVDGKETPITAFYETRKKLNPSPNGTTGQGALEATSPRLFVFIFNVSDYNLNLENDIDLIFQKILRPEDRFMVISNNYFLPEIVFKNPEPEKKVLTETLRKEADKLRMSIMEVESELKIQANNFVSRLSDPVERRQPDYPYEVFREFFTNYLLTFEQFKKGYFDMAKEQYIKIAAYLKSQDAEKWVLNFFQVGIFPRFKMHGQIQSALNLYTENTREDQTPDIRMKALIMELLPRLEDVDKWMVDNISKLFVDSGATVHTLLRKPKNTTFLDHYEYQPISTDSESILREIAQLTGGSLVQDKSAAEFVTEISLKEDIYYMLAFEPGGDDSKDSSLRVTINSDKNYRVVYDNRRKPQLFRNIMARIKETNPQIKIESMSLVNDMLWVKVSRVKTVPLGNHGETRIGRIEAKVMIVDSESNITWETKKFYKCKESESAFQIDIPLLKKGNYNVLVEVKDLLSWNTDTAGENMTIGSK
ncbi:MAG TPA: hypothetical protein VK186_09440 [Candidatus Deferrimicrobium sp.]|nr:hypothetical protein [Candidatus Deferrimicrobium sp.]